MVNPFGTNKANLVDGLMFHWIKLEKMKPSKLVEISQMLDTISILLIPPCFAELTTHALFSSKKWGYKIAYKSKNLGGLMSVIMVLYKGYVKKKLLKYMDISKSNYGDNLSITPHHSSTTTIQAILALILFTSTSQKTSTTKCRKENLWKW